MRRVGLNYFEEEYGQVTVWQVVKRVYKTIGSLTMDVEFRDELWCGLDAYFHFYNEERQHQSFGYKMQASRYLIKKKRLEAQNSRGMDIFFNFAMLTRKRKPL